MSPSVTLDTTPDSFTSTTVPSKTIQSRTLLLSPPSLSAHPEKLNNVIEAHDRNATDIQMLDRLSLSLVTLPDAIYDTILILCDADSTRSESQKLLDRNVLSNLVKALKPNGILRSQDGEFASTDSKERREAILAGLVVSDDGVMKPAYSATESVPLRFGKRKAEGGPTSSTIPVGTGAVSLNLNGKRADSPPTHKTAGVGLVDFSDDFDTPVEGEEGNSDDELIDEDTLLDESDLARPVIQRTSPLPSTPSLY